MVFWRKKSGSESKNKKKRRSFQKLNKSSSLNPSMLRRLSKSNSWLLISLKHLASKYPLNFFFGVLEMDLKEKSFNSCATIKDLFLSYSWRAKIFYAADSLQLTGKTLIIRLLLIRNASYSLWNLWKYTNAKMITAIYYPLKIFL